jgi:hypothetical protein
VASNQEAADGDDNERRGHSVVVIKCVQAIRQAPEKMPGGVDRRRRKDSTDDDCHRGERPRTSARRSHSAAIWPDII